MAPHDSQAKRKIISSCISIETRYPVKYGPCCFLHFILGRQAAGKPVGTKIFSRITPDRFQGRSYGSQQRQTIGRLACSSICSCSVSQAWNDRHQTHSRIRKGPDSNFNDGSIPKRLYPGFLSCFKSDKFENIGREGIVSAKSLVRSLSPETLEKFKYIGFGTHIFRHSVIKRRNLDLQHTNHTRTRTWALIDPIGQYIEHIYRLEKLAWLVLPLMKLPTSPSQVKCWDNSGSEGLLANHSFKTSEEGSVSTPTTTTRV